MTMAGALSVLTTELDEWDRPDALVSAGRFLIRRYFEEKANVRLEV